MVVKSSSGLSVSIVHTDKKDLYDADGTRWARHPECDQQDPYRIAYINTETMDLLLLYKDEIKRIIAGKASILTPTSVEEMRDYISRSTKRIKNIADAWPDQQLREILAEADEHGSNPIMVLEKKVENEIERTTPPKKLTEAPPVATESPKTPRTYRSTTRTRKQEGSVTVSLGEASVLLTPKQLEFMERLSENPEWDKNGVYGEYVASEYAQELSDTMNPMSMGAVLTTLREKSLIRTEKRRVGAIKCCMFQLTDLGVRVYNKLAGKER